MIQKLLIANRGEIAVRIIRSCREMGISPVAVYSDADKESLHVKMADEAVCIGPAASAKSYLHKQNIITAAILTGSEAIHPGVGYLSENSSFAKDVKEEGLIFIGAEPDAIELLGDKVKARNLAKKLGIPVTPGSIGSVADLEQSQETIKEIGFPMIIKAAAGGGGRGMRIVRTEKELKEQLPIASNEAEMNFASGVVYLEKYLENPRHVELQILADGKGSVLILGERDCSVQKNHQKLLEESPSPGVTEKMRHKMSKDAKKIFQELHYAGAGTIEFLVSGDSYYFMEVNARVQVEHPVTELCTNIDIIRQQILACTENRLEFSQDAIKIHGYALECRINAITPGKITQYIPADGPWVRTDSFLYPGFTVSPYYDSMIAKVIIFAENRERGLKRMLRALDEIQISGIQTNIESQKRIIQSRQFQSGTFGTSLYAELTEEGIL